MKYLNIFFLKYSNNVSSDLLLLHINYKEKNSLLLWCSCIVPTVITFLRWNLLSSLSNIDGNLIFDSIILSRFLLSFSFV